MMWVSDFVGKPFEDGARGPDAYDCWGLVRAVYAEMLGIDLPAYGEIAARDLVAVARTMGTHESSDPWRLADLPATFDVALMRSPRGGRAIVHVGVLVAPDRVLHTEAASHSVVVPLAHPLIRSRVAGFRRHKAAA